MASRPLIPNSTYRIKSGSSDVYLDCSPTTGSVTAKPGAATSQTQQWTISPGRDGDYEIKSATNGQALSTDSQNQLFCGSSARRATWTIEPRGSDAYVIGNALNARVMRRPRGNGPVTAEIRDNGALQRWILEPDPLGLNVGTLPSNSLRVIGTGTPAGGRGGAAFDCSHSVVGARLQEVRVWIDGYVSAIQLVYNLRGQIFSTGCHGRVWGAGIKKTFSLAQGEVIVRVEGRAGSLLDQLLFTTNTGRQSDRFGGWGGTPFVWSAPSPTAGLGWFTGAGAYYIDSLTPHFIQ